MLRKGLEEFKKLLNADYDDHFKVDVVWILSNIAGDSASCRDALLSGGVLPDILKIMGETKYLELQKKCIWMMSNVVRHSSPALEADVVSTCIPFACHLQ